MNNGHVTMFSGIMLKAIGISQAIVTSFEMNISWSTCKTGIISIGVTWIIRILNTDLTKSTWISFINFYKVNINNIF